MSKLVTLEDHDIQASAYHWRKWGTTNKTPPTTGIACPNCGAELLDININEQFTVFPPKTSVECSSCNWRGARVA